MDSSSPSLEELAEEVRDLLASRLTEDDQRRLQATFKAISSQVRWGRVEQKVFPAIFASVERALFEDLGEFADPQYYRNGSAWYNPSWDDFSPLLADQDPKALLRRHYLTLLVIKKLVGILKSRTRRGLRGIPILTEEKERELLKALEGNEAEPNEETALVACTKAHGRARGWHRSKRASCFHFRTKRIMLIRDRQRFWEEICLDCNSSLSLTPIPPGQRGRRRRKDEPCPHEQVQWVEGEEGRRARCANPECHQEIQDPTHYRWVDAGLEPFGDDPSQDEVITLCTDYSS